MVQYSQIQMQYIHYNTYTRDIGSMWSNPNIVAYVNNG
jgi:hypothetical protein